MATATLNERSRRLNLSDPGIALIAAALFLIPLWAPWQAVLTTRPHYEFYPILVLGMVFLVRHRLLSMEPGSIVPGNSIIVGVMAVLSVVGLFFGYVVGNSTILSLATVLTFSMVLYATGGRALWRRIIPVFFLLTLMTPPPWGLDMTLTLKLQQLSVAIASRVLDMFQIFHVVNTNTLEVDGQRFLVEEACSGIQSMFSILAFAMFYAIWNERGLFRTIFLLAGALLFDLSLNVVRICLGVMAKITGDINLLDGWPHEILGIVVFVLGLLLTLSWDVVLEEVAFSKFLPKVLFTKQLRRLKSRAKSSSRSRSSAAGMASSQGGPGSERGVAGAMASPLRKPSLIVMALWAVFVLPMTTLAALQLPKYLKSGTADQNDPVAQALAARGDDRLKLLDDLTRKSRNTFEPPRAIGPWTLLPESAKSTERTLSFGSKSESFLYANGKSIIQVSIDYPFYGFHDLNICYDFGGWRVSEISTEQLGSTPDFPFNASSMSRGIDQYAVMVYSAFLDDGQWRLFKPVTTMRNEIKLSGEFGIMQIASQGIANRVSILLSSLPTLVKQAFFAGPQTTQIENYTNYQIQALLIDTDTIGEDKRKAVVEFFRVAAPLLKTQFLQAKSAGATQGEPATARTE